MPLVQSAKKEPYFLLRTLKNTIQFISTPIFPNVICLLGGIEDYNGINYKLQQRMMRSGTQRIENVYVSESAVRS